MPLHTSQLVEFVEPFVRIAVAASAFQMCICLLLGRTDPDAVSLSMSPASVDPAMLPFSARLKGSRFAFELKNKREVTGNASLVSCDSPNSSSQ